MPRFHERQYKDLDHAARCGSVPDRTRAVISWKSSRRFPDSTLTIPATSNVGDTSIGYTTSSLPEYQNSEMHLESVRVMTSIRVIIVSLIVVFALLLLIYTYLLKYLVSRAGKSAVEPSSPLPHWQMILIGLLAVLSAPLALVMMWFTRRDHCRFYMISTQMERAYRKDRLQRAEKLSHEYLSLADRFAHDWNYGNAVHDANQILGLIRLREGNVDAAKLYLLRAGLTPGSPQLDSFGPNMVLARELLQRGERLVVAEYVDLVAAFWAAEKPHRAPMPDNDAYLTEKRRWIEQWKIDIAGGITPEFWLWRRAI